MTGQTDRTPYCHKIRYGITGAPTLTEDEMDGSHAPGIGVSPTLIELVYSAARDGKPASVSASVTGDWTRFGERADGQVAVHFKNGPDGWPAWLAEEARLHDPAAAVCICGHTEAQHFEDACLVCDCGDYLVPEAAREVIARWRTAALQARADRAAVLREAADAITEVIEADRAYSPRRSNDRAALGGAREIVLNLIDKPRRMADEAQQPEAEAPVAPEAPPVCEGFQWIGQSFATCDRCGQPAWEHAGEEVPVEGAGPFDTRRTVRPWKPGEADAIRTKWGASAAAQQPKEARP